MGIYCEINLSKSEDETYAYKPGSVVTGKIRYFMDRRYQFTSISVTLKGTAEMCYYNKMKGKHYRNEHVCCKIESPVNIIEKYEPIPMKQFETEICFILLQDIPGSLNYEVETAKYYAKCTIEYHVCINFVRHELDIDKCYRKEIRVVPGMKSWMTTKPLMYSERQFIPGRHSLFSNKKRFVNIKATIVTSLLRAEENVEVHYEIDNYTKYDIREVQINLLETTTYKATGKKQKQSRAEVAGTRFTCGVIRSGETAVFSVQIKIPASCASIDNSTVITRGYSVSTVVVLPRFINNISLEMPLQVMSLLPCAEDFTMNIASTSTAELDASAVYWEGMDGNITLRPHRDKDDTFKQLAIGVVDSDSD